jgi:hypothetical protein
LDDYDCDIILYYIYILNFSGSVLRTNSRTIRYTLHAFDISTMNFIGLIHVSSFFHCFGCLSKRAENTLSVASLLHRDRGRLHCTNAYFAVHLTDLTSK